MCKIITTQTGKTTLIAIELPQEHSSFAKIELNDGCKYADGKGNRLTLHIMLRERNDGESIEEHLSTAYARHIFQGSGTYQCLGTTYHMTQEAWSGVLEQQGNRYRDYKNVVNYPPHDGEDYIDLFCILDAHKSARSLLDANQLFFDNPVEKYFVNKLTGENEIRQDWQQYEERLFDPRRTFFFKLVE